MDLYIPVDQHSLNPIQLAVAYWRQSLRVIQLSCGLVPEKSCPTSFPFLTTACMLNPFSYFC